MALLRELLERAVVDESYDGVLHLKRLGDRRFVLCEASEATHVLRLKGFDEPNVSCVFAEDAFGNDAEWRQLALSVDPLIGELVYREDYEPSASDWVVLLPWNVPIVSTFWRRMPNDAWVTWFDYPAVLERLSSNTDTE